MDEPVMALNQIWGRTRPQAQVMYHRHLCTLTIKIYNRIDIGRNIFTGHTLVLTINGVVQRAIQVPHHTQPRAHSEAVEVARKPIAYRLAILHYSRPT